MPQPRLPFYPAIPDGCRFHARCPKVTNGETDAAGITARFLIRDRDRFHSSDHPVTGGREGG